MAASREIFMSAKFPSGCSLVEQGVLAGRPGAEHCESFVSATGLQEYSMTKEALSGSQQGASGMHRALLICCAERRSGAETRKGGTYRNADGFGTRTTPESALKRVHLTSFCTKRNCSETDLPSHTTVHGEDWSIPASREEDRRLGRRLI